jgi:hypothetical protein
MSTLASKAWDKLGLISRGGPALCNVAVTTACNAACDSLDHLRKGRVSAAAKTLVGRRNFVSLGAVLENAHALTRLARLR